MNNYGFFTINSQPAVNGAPSEDKIFGWGPANGYVYQKVCLALSCACEQLGMVCFQAYLEFFASPELLSALLPQIERDSQITYYAINKRGDLKTNTHSEGPNAVTWGVFPGKEVVQPTIVEAVSFMAWKVRLLRHRKANVTYT
jgi:methylenetetrahydrofolate reductase (NADPH)